MESLAKLAPGEFTRGKTPGSRKRPKKMRWHLLHQRASYGAETLAPLRAFTAGLLSAR